MRFQSPLHPHAGRNVLRGLGCELAAVAAIVGGVLAGEVIKAVSGKDAPLRNIFLFDGHDSNGVVEYLHSEPENVAKQAHEAEAISIE